MGDPHFKLQVGVYEIDKIVHGHLKIRNLSSRVQFNLPLAATPLVPDQTEH